MAPSVIRELRLAIRGIAWAGKDKAGQDSVRTHTLQKLSSSSRKIEDPTRALLGIHDLATRNPHAALPCFRAENDRLELNSSPLHPP